MHQFQSYFSQQTWNSLQRKTEPAQKKGNLHSRLHSEEGKDTDLNAPTTRIYSSLHTTQSCQPHSYYKDTNIVIPNWE